MLNTFAENLGPAPLCPDADNLQAIGGCADSVSHGMSLGTELLILGGIILIVVAATVLTVRELKMRHKAKRRF